MVGRGQPGVLHRLADAERRASRETHLHDAVRFLRRFDARARRSAWRLLAGWPRHGAGEVVAVSPKWPRRARSLYRLRRVPRERRRANRRSRLRAVYRLSGRVAAGSYGCRWASASRQNHGKPWIFPARRVFSRRVGGVSESRALTIDTPRSSIHAGSRPTQSSGRETLTGGVTTASRPSTPPAPRVVDRTRDGVL